MIYKRLSYITIAICLVPLLLLACKSEPAPSPEEENGPAAFEVRDAADARDMAIAYLRKHEPENASGSGLSWAALRAALSVA